MVSTSAAKRDEAESATRSLVDGVPEVEAVLLFGSVARGDAGPDSDVDLMVVSRDPLSSAITRSHLEECRQVSLTSHTWDSLERAQRDDWSFFVHLREEGELLHGSGWLLDQLSKVKRPPADTWRAALAAEIDSLAKFDDLGIFGGRYTFPLSHIFTTARYTCMLDNTAAGEIAFDRDTAFAIFGERHPELAEEADCVRAIWPFRARTQGRDIDLPFDADDVSQVERALSSAQRIVRSAIDG